MQPQPPERIPDEFPIAEVDDLEGHLDDDLRARVKVELEPGERLLWAGRSDPPSERFGWGYFVFGAIAAFFFLLGSVATADAFGHYDFPSTELKDIPDVHRVELIIRKNLIMFEESGEARDRNVDA
jgi:hypothetical protein